jgi:hypothetical protein
VNTKRPLGLAALNAAETLLYCVKHSGEFEYSNSPSMPPPFGQYVFSTVSTLLYRETTSSKGTLGRRTNGASATRLATCKAAEAGKLQPEKILNGKGGAVIVAIVEPVVGDAGVTRALVFW